MPVALLRELLACPSITPEDAGCQRIIAQRLLGAGFTVKHFQFGEVENLWATHGNEGPTFCFAGHTDVVPPGPIDAWTSPPFLPTERNGNLYARGAADMKASDAAMTVALERLAVEGHPGTVALLLTSDEEGPGRDGTRRMLAELREHEIRIDAALVGEPTSEAVFGDTIKVGRRGSMNGHITVRGKQGHTAYPALARNAAHDLVAVVTALNGVDWGAGTAEFPSTTLQVSNLHAGTGAGNVIPGVAEAWLNIRFGTDWPVEAVQERIAAALAETGASCEVSWDVSALPFLTRDRRLIDAIQDALPIRAAESTGGGTSDARFFAAQQIPVVEFGPINASIHAVDEHVSIADLELLAEVYVRAAQRWFAAGT